MRKFSCAVSVLVVQNTWAFVDASSVIVLAVMLMHKKLSHSLSKIFLYFSAQTYRHDGDVEAEVRWGESLWLSDAPNKKNETLQPSCFSSDTLTHTPTSTPTSDPLSQDVNLNMEELLSGSAVTLTSYVGWILIQPSASTAPNLGSFNHEHGRSELFFLKASPISYRSLPG